jgi:hypothetical protein
MQLKRDHARVNLDLVKAELDKEIRTNPEKFGIEKVTEAAVTHTIISQGKYKESQEELMQAEYESNIASAAVNAFNARKVALENLVKLYGQQYFAGPKMPRDLSYEVANFEKQKEANRKVGEAMGRRRT